ncbi:MAG: SGNH/GDSL hydrolase family protein [Elusimicrobia bacterium]|nr:SGNH/GDSL hydrolase family protein [Elusimicrobiota bacterium]
MTEKPNRVLKIFFALIAAATPVAVWLVGIIDIPVRSAVLLSFLLFLIFLLLFLTKYSKYALSVNLIIFIITGTITLITADFILRISLCKKLYYRPDEMFIQQWPKWPPSVRYKKNITFSGTTFGDLSAMSKDKNLREKRNIIFRTDSYGFRNNPAENHKVYDVVILGDSFGAGTGTTQDRTWVNILNTRYGLRTYNLSVPGSPWRSYQNLSAEIERLKLNSKSTVLMAIFTGNDLDENCQNPDINLSLLSLTGLYQFIKPSLDIFRSRSPIRQLISRITLSDSSTENVLVRKLPDGQKILFYRPYADRKNRSKEEIKNHPNYRYFTKTILKIKDIADKHSANLKIVLIPSKPEVYSWVLDNSAPWTADTKPSAFSVILKDFCKTNDIKFLDLKQFLVPASKEVFNDSKSLLWWTDDTHWNETGHSVVAETVYKSFFK